MRRAFATAGEIGPTLDALSLALGSGGAGPFALVALFVPTGMAIARLAGEAERRLQAPVIGCTTAGEIAEGYAEDTIVALALPRSHFTAHLCPIQNIATLDRAATAHAVLTARHEVAAAEPEWPGQFAMLLVDGLSRAEDRLVSAIAPALGTTPLFGGSAGDGLDFTRTQVFANGHVHQDGAVLALIRTRCEVEVFRFDHFRPTEKRMVVTAADPANRLVKEINAEPAAAEYARIVGKDPGQLTPFTFAANPVVVRLGGQHHVRAIQQVEPNGDLRFFSAIDEGLVLSVADKRDIVEHLEESLAGLHARRAPAAILACDCILRRLEAEQSQRFRAVSNVLTRYGVVGFSTYGEQHNGLHVNQTFTGVALYPPEDP
ncbi:MAG: FIST N-terminal domain-containing protein [Pseudomonadota bacterium]